MSNGWKLGPPSNATLLASKPSMWISASYSSEPWMVSRLLERPLMPPVSMGTAVVGPPWTFMAGMSSASES